MAKQTSVVFLGLAILLPAVLSGADVQSRKPTVELTLPILRPEPPETLSAVLARVDLAAHVNVLSSQPRARQIPGGSEHLTFYIAEIVDKGRSRRFARAGERIKIVQVGGVFQEADRILRVSEKDNPPLAAGRAYVLTLQWDDTVDAYHLAFGPDSVFEIQDGKVHPRSRGAAARELAGKSVTDAVRLIR
jgi:hypothetical protein